MIRWKRKRMIREPFANKKDDEKEDVEKKIKNA